MSDKWMKSVKKGWLKPETQKIWQQHVEARAKLKSHIYTILLRSQQTCPQIQHNYIWSLDEQDIQGCLSQNVMRDSTCKTKVHQSSVYPLPGVLPLSFSVLQTFPVQQTCANLSGWTNSSFNPALGGCKCHSQVVLSDVVLCLVSYKLQIVDLELSIWIPALPPSVALKYWVTINPGQRMNPNFSFYPSPSSTLALDAA